MNERIQKIYDQADKFAKENRTQTISGPGNNYFELFHEKFAELIVKEMVDECAKVCVQHAGWTPDMIANQVKQHFGVEE